MGRLLPPEDRQPQFHVNDKRLSFNIGLENTGTLIQQVVGGYLEVTRSRSDLRPVLETLNGLECAADRTVRQFTFANYGWSQPTDATFEGGFVDPDDGRTILPVSQALAGGWPFPVVDFGPFIDSLGGQLAVFPDRSVTCVGGDLAACFEALRSQGAFGALTEAVYPRLDLGNESGAFTDFEGRLSYGWTDVDGIQRTETRDFRVTFRLALFDDVIGCGEGGTGLTPIPNTLVFALDRGPYRLPFAVAAAVRPGFVQRWQIEVEAPRSSTHEFQIVLQLADGREVRSRPVDLLYFRSAQPREDF
jgi:hypothetical protein